MSNKIEVKAGSHPKNWDTQGIIVASAVGPATREITITEEGDLTEEDGGLLIERTDLLVKLMLQVTLLWEVLILLTLHAVRTGSRFVQDGNHQSKFRDSKGRVSVFDVSAKAVTRESVRSCLHENQAP